MRILTVCLLFLIVASCKQKADNRPQKLFTRIAADESGVDFKNQLKDTDDFNIIEYLYYYNGGGVAAGDIDNDGLCDLYFSSNQGSNGLFLNKGNFTFGDITGSSGTGGVEGWKTGVCMADVNGDGWLDIYVSGVGGYKKFDGRNQLLINNQDLTFSDKTEEYGLSFKGFSTQATFFDYDNDGDLDMYLANHSVHTPRSLGEKALRYEHDSLAGDRLYRNELVPAKKPFFTDVTREAGIFNSQIGYGLSASASDFDNDGFQDIYVANDFHENDYLYMNNGNGTFRQVLESAMPHTSRFSMGTSAADLNEDGWNDIVTLDMRPREEEVIKTTSQEDNYDIYQFKLSFGYHYQFSRNTMQLSNGLDADGTPLFTDVASFAGVDATDWSWSPVIGDFDNDGWKDLFVSNGILQRPNDLDYTNFISSDSAQRFLSDEALSLKMPGGKVPDMIFRNMSDMTFKDMTGSWMDSVADLSNGAVTADLDNDGDLDIVINSLNDDAVILRNNSPDSVHYLRIRLQGDTPNTSGIGAKVVISIGGRSVHLEQQPFRGWESSLEPILHSGLGKAMTVDSLLIVWPDKRFEVIRNIRADQVITAMQSNAAKTWSYIRPPGKRLVSPLPVQGFTHHENKFNPFEREPLLIHGLSTQGPCLAVADFNGDGLDDYFIGGASDQAGAVYFQNSAGGFIVSRQPDLVVDSGAEDTAAAAVDVNGDGAVDLVVGGGGQQFLQPDKRLRPRLYLNNGRGQLKRAPDHIPAIDVNASCIAVADLDSDGDSDLFVGGLVVSTFYGMDPQSFVLINDGHGKFEEKTESWMTDPIPGMVTDALFEDVNGDRRPDLVLTGEWMPVKVMINNGGSSLGDNTDGYGLSQTFGMWNTLAASDFDKDGDVDLVAGNMGMNSRLTASETRPLELYAGDIDSNFSLDQIITYYNNGVKYPFITKDLLVKQVPPLKRKFLRYKDFGRVTLDGIIPPEKQALHKTANILSSVYLENDGNKKFIVHRLPKEAQYSAVYCILPADVDRDGKEDLLVVGNLDAVQPDIGRFDGGYGLILLGDGRGTFSPQPISSGFVVKGQGRDMKVVLNSKGEKVYVVARNNDSVLYFK